MVSIRVLLYLLIFTARRYSSAAYTVIVSVLLVVCHKSEFYKDG